MTVYAAGPMPDPWMMLRIVQYSLKQLIVSVLQQLIEVWHVRWAEAASLAAAEKCVYALAVRRRDEPASRG